MNKSLKLVILFLLCSCFIVTVTAGNDYTIETIAEDRESLTFSFDLHHFSREEVIIQNEAYYRLRIDGQAFTHTTGEPELPYLSYSIIIPDDLEATVEVSEMELETESLKIAPSKGIILRHTNPADIPYTFSGIYNQDSVYPEIIAEVGDPYILRDFRGQTIRIFPFRYNPAENRLYVIRAMTLNISFTNRNGKNVKKRDMIEYQPEFKNIYSNHFLNFDPHRYPRRNDAGRMLVIYYDDFQEQAAAFQEWKILRGIPTEKYPVSEIGDRAAEIKDFISEQYDQDDGLVYVQLIGDHQQVPSFIVNGGGSDPTYSLLEGDDYYPDIFVGRFSSETAAQAATQVERSIYYERYLQTDAEWLRRAAGIASSEGDDPSDIDHMDAIRDALLAYNYNHVDRIYAPQATSNDVTRAVNNGRSFINYAGHGSSHRWTTTGFSSTDVNQLTNDNKLPFIISVACVNGNFTSTTCFAEAWLRAANNTTGNPTGAVNVYASSINQAWYPPMSAQEAAVDLLVSEEISVIGKLLFAGSIRMIDQWGNQGVREFRNWNIFGDVSLQTRTNTPRQLIVDHPGRLHIGQTNYRVNTNISGAFVALADDSLDIIAAGRTSENGSVLLQLTEPIEELTTLTLTATARNYTVYSSPVPVVPQPDYPYMTLDRSSFEEAVTPDTLISKSLGITNRGREDLIIHSRQTSAEQPPRDNETFLACSQSGYQPDSNYEWTFSLYNDHEDETEITELEINFPEGVIVSQASPLSGGDGEDLNPDQTAGENIRIIWSGNEENGVVFPGEMVTATVNVTIRENLEPDIILPYRIRQVEPDNQPENTTGEILVYNENNNWLEITPYQAVISSEDTLGVEVNISSENVDYGEYGRYLLIRSNDRYSRLTSIPVFLTVVDTEQLFSFEITPTRLEGEGYFNEEVVYNFQINNEGLLPDRYRFEIVNNQWDTIITERGDNRSDRYPGRPEGSISITDIIEPEESGFYRIKVLVEDDGTGTDTANIRVISDGNPETRESIAVETASLGYDPDLPRPPSRFVSGFSPVDGVVIRYPVGIPYNLIAMLAEHTKVYTIVANENTMNQAIGIYTQNDINTENCEFIIAPTNTVWIRDYGAWFTKTGNNDIATIDFSYNRPRHADNAIPAQTAEHIESDIFHLPLTHSGGNIITDGRGLAVSTDGLISDNAQLSIGEIEEIMYRYLGVTDYLIMESPVNLSLGHIDTWIKFLAEDKVMIRQVPADNPYYEPLEDMARYFRNNLSSLGSPWRIFRVETPQNEPYINSLIVNDKIYLPVTGGQNDQAALEAYQQAMPGYEIIGVAGNWDSNDAIYSRVNTIPDLQMLHIEHTKPARAYSGVETLVQTEIIAFGDHEINPDSVFVYWRTGTEGDFHAGSMVFQAENSFIGAVGGQAQLGQTVYYYFKATSMTGKSITAPYAGQRDPYTIEVNRIGVFGKPENVKIRRAQEEVIISWDKVPGATSYIIEAVEYLDGEFTDATDAGEFNSYPGKKKWRAPMNRRSRFYRVKAVRN